MKLSKIIAIANKVYPDGLVEQAFLFQNKPTARDGNKGVGDGLAEFIARELTDTYDEKASTLNQLREASRVMSTACDELRNVSTELYSYFLKEGRKSVK